MQVKIILSETLRRGYQKIAIFSTIHEGTLSIKRRFLSENNDKLKIVHNEEFPPDVKDFKTLITKFKSKTNNDKPDAIFTNVFFGQVGIFARQLREMGVKQDLFCIELFEDKNEVKSSNGALIDQWYVQASEPSGEFLKNYSNKFSGESSFGAANGYDAVSLIKAAILESKITSKDLNDYLHNVKDFTGVSGMFSSTGDNRFTLTAIVKVVKQDGFEPQVVK